MKRIVTLILAAGLILGATSAAQAVDFKISGLMQHRVSFADRNFAKGNGDDKMRAASRIRTQIDVIASESLKGVVFFEIGHQNWGKSAEGASLGTDGKEVKVRYSYVDWAIPQTDAKVRMGLQKYTLPNFTGIGSPILDADGAGINITNQFTENVAASLFWLRAENDNDPDMAEHDAHDAMDFIGLTVPLTFDGVKVTPWAMYGAIGRDSFDGAGSASGYGASETILAERMLPIGAPALLGADIDRHGNAWWVGVASELTYFDPFRVALDAAYGSVDMGTVGKFDVERSGWFASILAEYKMDYFTPGILFWYASGDDSSSTNGSERMPSIEGSWTASSYGFDDNYGRIACDMLGLSNDGKMGVYLQAKDISFMEDLTHVLRVGFIKGTNNTEMARNGGAYISSADEGFGRQLYMTTADKAWEVNFDTQYKIYQDLTLGVELGYINLDLDENVWGKDVDNYRENNVRGAVTLKYAF